MSFYSNIIKIIKITLKIMTFFLLMVLIVVTTTKAYFTYFLSKEFSGILSLIWEFSVDTKWAAYIPVGG